MNLEEYNYQKLTTAHIGISSEHWTSILQEKDINEAKEIMHDNRFDILPVKDADESFSKYYVTETRGNYEKINLKNITKDDCIYYNTDFDDLIKRFNEKGKESYFLTNNRGEVIGLISYVHINSRLVYNYLFQMFCDLEQSISNVLKDHTEEEEIIDYLREDGDKFKNNVVKEREKEKEQGLDNSIWEYMYLQTIAQSLKKFHNELSNKQFEKIEKIIEKFNPKRIYGELRNNIMHPVRRIISGNPKERVHELCQFFEDYKKIKEFLANCNKE